MIHPISTYSSFRAVTLSDTDLVTFDSLYCNTAGTVLISPDATTAPTTFTVLAGAVLPIAVRSGRVMLTGTAVVFALA